MKAADLRKAILQYAVEGKLVPQDNQDEPASILYEKIIAEKENLIKQGKIKKEKPLPPITDDGIPYNIPENWKWVRLGEVITLLSGQDLKLSEINNENKGIPYITGASAIKHNNIVINRWTIKPTVISEKNDILITCKGTIGKISINYIGDIHIARQIMNIKSFKIYNIYLYFFLLSCQKFFIDKGKSIIPGISRNDILYILFPIPPLKEQERIVKKIDELMGLCDKLEQEEEKLLALDKNFMENLPKSILQYAVEGKLVNQDIYDEPASILYEKIMAEKENLIKQGKIKKEKPLPPITDDEIPYEIPENWKWVRLGEIVSVIQGTSYNKSDITSNKKDIRIIRGGNIKNYNINMLNDDIYIKQANFNIEKQIYKNDIIIVASTGSKTILGNASFAYTDYINTQIGAFLRIIRPYNSIFFPYLRIIFMTNYYMDYIKIHSKGIGINNIKTDTINNFPIPLPPLKEQERIIKKVNELLTYCNKLKDII